MSFIEINGEQMMKCNYCGNIWDGYAQCHCYQLECYRVEDTEPDHEAETKVNTEAETDEKSNAETTEDTIDTSSK